jgi:hypothetical protein
MVVATLRVKLYGSPAQELARMREGDVPRWVGRIYGSYGKDVGTAPLSASIEAVAEELGRRLESVAMVLRKAEARGWRAEVRGDTLLIHTGLATRTAQERMEEDGVWTLVRGYSTLAANQVEWVIA